MKIVLTKYVYFSQRAPLHIANQKGNLILAELLIKNGADINKIDDDGRTELHYAVEYGRKDIVKLLIDSGGLTNVMDKDGEIALEIASQRSMLNLKPQAKNSKNELLIN